MFTYRKLVCLLTSSAALITLAIEAYPGIRVAAPRLPDLRSQQTVPPEPVAKRIRESSVNVIVFTKHGDDSGGANYAGFIIAPEVVATCYDVVKHARAIVVDSLGNPGHGRLARILRFDEKSDIALLGVKGLEGTPSPITNQKDVRVGDKVYVETNWLGWQSGWAVESDITELNDENETSLVKFTFPYRRGVSGSPVVNGKGEILGIVDTRRQFELKPQLAVSSRHIQSLVAGGVQFPADAPSDQLEIPKCIDKCVSHFSNNSPVIAATLFSGEFFPVADDLKKRLATAFPLHSFALAEMLLFHHVWGTGTTLVIMKDSKDGRVADCVSDNLGRQSLLGKVADLLTLYPARDANDALFKVQTLSELLAAPRSLRIASVQRDSGTITTLFCSRFGGPVDYGMTLRVPIDHELRFGRISFDTDNFEANKRCAAVEHSK